MMADGLRLSYTCKADEEFIFCLGMVKFLFGDAFIFELVLAERSLNFCCESGCNVPLGFGLSYIVADEFCFLMIKCE